MEANKNVTRNYYFPKNDVGRQILNRVINEVGGSVDTISFTRDINGKELMNVTFSCNKMDVRSVEKILKFYDLL